MGDSMISGFHGQPTSTGLGLRSVYAQRKKGSEKSFGIFFRIMRHNVFSMFCVIYVSFAYECFVILGQSFFRIQLQFLYSQFNGS